MFIPFLKRKLILVTEVCNLGLWRMQGLLCSYLYIFLVNFNISECLV